MLETVPERFRFTPLSILILILFGLVWPVLSFVFMDMQVAMTESVVDPATEIYYPTIGIQLFTLILVLLAVWSERVGAADVGLRGLSRWTALTAVGFLVAANLLLLFLQFLIAGSAPASFATLDELLPRTQHERIVWVILTVIVAVSEELTFRGYLVTRLGRLLRGRIWVAAVISSLAFASGHLYQGVGGFILIFVYGMMFAALYIKTRSLYPGIIAHFIQDAVVAVAPDLVR